MFRSFAAYLEAVNDLLAHHPTPGTASHGKFRADNVFPKQWGAVYPPPPAWEDVFPASLDEAGSIQPSSWAGPAGR